MTNPTETRVVPCEPTEKMVHAAFVLAGRDAFASAIYKAMLAAAPAAPDLSDPTVVHVNMLQGAIARLTPEQVKHLYHELFAPAPAAPAAPAQEPVAVIGKNWQLLWVSADVLQDIVERTGVKIGSTLYATPPTPVAASPEAKPAPAVKALVWTKTKVRGAIRLLVEADTPVGLYQIRLASDWIYLARGPGGFLGKDLRTEQAAMEVCAADYDRRVRACLVDGEAGGWPENGDRND